MARAKKTKPTLDSLFFATPEQRVMRLLLSEPTTTFTMRVLASKLKGVRGIGGADGLKKILDQLEEMGLVQFVDNGRAVCLHDDEAPIRALKIFSAMCDLEGIRALAEPLSTKAILFGSRSNGKARSDSDYDLFVVSDSPDEVTRVITTHPLGRNIEVIVWRPDDYMHIDEKDPALAAKLGAGIVMWGPMW